MPTPKSGPRVRALTDTDARGFERRGSVPAIAAALDFGQSDPKRKRRMTILHDVERLVLRLAPQAVCDDCIAERLGFSVRQHANHKTRELAGSNGFVRSKDACSLCGATKLVIRHR